MLYFIGDIHGEFKLLANALVLFKVRDSVLIQVGDFGVGFKPKKDEQLELKYLNLSLKKLNNMLYVIRGNHDDPSYFSTANKAGNIIFVEDYSVINVENKKILMAGGSISIDRAEHKEGRGYWQKETFEYLEDKVDNAINDIGAIDIVVTHSAPTEFWPYTLNGTVNAYAKLDGTLLADIAKDRGDHSRFLKHLCGKNMKPKHWYYGHYHVRHKEIYDGINYRVLGTMEIFQHL